MKLKKWTAFVLVLLMLASLIVPATAAESTASSSSTTQSAGNWYDITAANISLDDNVYIYFALNNSSELSAADEYGVIFWTAEQEEGDYTWEKAQANRDAIVCTSGDGWSNPETGKVYFDYGISAKQMTDLVWGQGYAVVDGTVFSSDKIVEYSVQTYCGNKLGILEGGTRATEDEGLKELLRDMLAYGSSAQKYFQYKTDDLAGDMLKWSQGLKYFSNDDGTCYVDSMGSCKDTEIYIPKVALNGSCAGEKVVQIGDSAFVDANITSVTVPAGVESIDDGAFYGATALSEIRLPKALEWIGSSAFDGTAYYNDPTHWEDGLLYKDTFLLAADADAVGERKNIQIKTGTTLIAEYLFSEMACESVAIPVGVKEVPYGLFADCVSLSEVSLPAGIERIDSRAFMGCTQLSEITLPAGIKTIGLRAFMGCTQLSEISLPAGVKSIGSRAFMDCTQLSEVTFPTTGLKSIDSYAFSGCTALSTVSLPQGLRSIGEKAFSGCTLLSALTLPADIQEIDGNAFLNCSALVDITLPSGIEWIDATAFQNTGYYNTTENWDGSLLYAGSYLLTASGGQTGIAVKDGTVTIAYGAFGASASTLESVSLPASTTMVCGGFSELDLTTLTVAEGNTAYFVAGNCLVERATKTIVSGFSNSTIPADSGITAIGVGAFAGSAITSLTVPEGVVSIGEFAFGCSQIEDITLAGSVVSIGAWAFNGCANLETIAIPDNVITIDSHAFYECEALTTVTLSEASKLETIGQSAFGDCFRLATITLPQTVTYIGDYAFSYADITAVSLYEGLTYIGKDAFYYTNLTGVAIPSTVRYIGTGAFVSAYEDTAQQKMGLQELTMVENDLYCVQSGCLIDKTKKTIIGGCAASVIPSDGSVTAIGEGAFAYCGMTSIAIPDCVTSVEGNAFQGCKLLASVTLGNGISEISDFAFAYCDALESITLPANVTRIGYGSFDYAGLKSIELSEHITFVDEWAFNGATLESVIISGSLKDISYGVFKDCKSLRTIILKSGVETIEAYTFGCTNYNYATLDIYIPKTVTSIGTYSLQNWRFLNIHYEGTAAEWEQVTKNADWISDYNEVTYTYETPIPSTIPSSGSGEAGT